MNQTWHPDPSLLERVSAHLLSAVKPGVLEPYDPGLASMLLQTELARIYQAVLLATYSHERAESVLLGIQWRRITFDGSARALLLPEFGLDLARAIQFRHVELLIRRQPTSEYQRVVQALAQCVPSATVHLKPTGDERYTVAVTASALLHEWHLQLNGAVDERVVARFPVDWLVSLYSRYAMDKRMLQPCLSLWNRQRAALIACVEQYGLGTVLQRIESAAPFSRSPFDLFDS